MRQSAGRSCRIPRTGTRATARRPERNAIEGGELVRRAVEHPFGARTVVARDVDDQSVVELAHVFDRLDDAADLVVGVGKVGAKDIGLFDEKLLLDKPERIPIGSSFGQGVNWALAGMMPSRFWLAKIVRESCSSRLEQVHVADLLDPLRCRVMRRVRSARHVIDEEWLLGRDRLDLLHVLDRLVGHGRGQVPARLALEGVDGRRIAEQVRLPLAGVTADEAIEILETHAVRPLVEGPGLGRLVERRVVILAKPRGRVPVSFRMAPRCRSPCG